MAYDDHREQARREVNCAILTVSDTRTEANDASGQCIRDLLELKNHRIVHYGIVPDEPIRIRQAIEQLCEKTECEAIVINGGTGISPRDRTIEAVASLLEQRLDGFGELFRYLSYDDIGSGAMLSRAMAGVYAGRIIFCIPGSRDAVRLAMERLILLELGHIVSELKK